MGQTSAPGGSTPTALFPRLAAGAAVDAIIDAIPWFGSVWRRSPADQQARVIDAVAGRVGEGLGDLVNDLRQEWDDQLRTVRHKCGWCDEIGTQRMQITLTSEAHPREAHACADHGRLLVTWAVA